LKSLSIAHGRELVALETSDRRAIASGRNHRPLGRPTASAAERRGRLLLIVAPFSAGAASTATAAPSSGLRRLAAGAGIRGFPLLRRFAAKIPCDPVDAGL
jgi:hypothetical protein